MSSHKTDSHTHTLPETIQDIPIFTKLYEFYKLLYQYLKLFPKRDRYTLGEKIDNLTLNIFELVITAGTTSKEYKLPMLKKSVVSVDLLKILIRLAKDNQALDNKKYIQLEQQLQEIGRMLGGWKRSVKISLEKQGSTTERPPKLEL